MSKKLVISLSIVFGIIVVVLILFWTLFGLSSVTVEYSSSKINLSISDAEIVESGDFHMGACVLFESKKKSIENIENKAKTNKNFAYLRVLNIETVFPNKFVIHVAEREELFAVEFGQAEGKKTYFICDRDLRVLDVVPDLSEKNCIVLQNLSIKNENIEIGDFLDVEEKGVKNFYSAMLQNNITLSQQLGKFESAKTLKIEDELGAEYAALELMSKSGRKYLIENIDFAFAEKIQLLFSVESTLFGYENLDEAGNLLDENGQKIMLTLDENKRYLKDESGNIPLSISLLSRCEIVLANLVLDEFHNRTAKDIYYALQELD